MPMIPNRRLAVIKEDRRPRCKPRRPWMMVLLIVAMISTFKRRYWVGDDSIEGNSIEATAVGHTVEVDITEAAVEEPVESVSEQVSTETAEGPAVEDVITKETAEEPAESVSEELSTTDSERLLPHVVFGNLRFRRVCAPSYSSFVCLLLRFPFEVPLQDPAVSYPSPFNEDLYNITGIDIINGDELDACRNLEGSLEKVVKDCLEPTVDGESLRVKALWTRQPAGAATSSLYGTGSPSQHDRLFDFFGGTDHTIVLAGASPSPGTRTCIGALFPSCDWKFPFSFRKDYTNDLVCTDANKTRRVHLTVLVVHKLPKQDIVTHFQENRWYERNADETLRPLTVIAEYPIAHKQQQLDLLNRFEEVANTQRAQVAWYYNLTSESQRAALASAGYKLEHFFAFDGFPQYFPSETGGFHRYINKRHSEEEFLEQGGFPEWKPEFGSRCRGPISPNSLLTKANEVERAAFEKIGMDMRWYGRTWELANQLWYTVKGWGNGKLDCTHAKEVDGEISFYCVHRYLLMAMIDDFYDGKE